jgi:putative ABC transport system ATP-binding protein
VIALELHEVTKEHGGPRPVLALDCVSLAVEDGELVSIVGPSGSGKSTLLAVAGTLERPSSGSIRIAGEAAETMNEHQLAQLRAERIGFVFQQFFLIPSLTALENVATALLYRSSSAARRRREAEHALELVGLSARAAHRPGELSGGACQRVAIARAIAGEPSVVLADEPTGNLDSATGAEIFALLRELGRRGTTIVIVTHDLELARAVPRVVTLRDGRIETKP